MNTDIEWILVQAVPFIETLSDSDLSQLDICYLPTEKSRNITEEIVILETTVKVYVCRKVEILSSNMRKILPEHNS